MSTKSSPFDPTANLDAPPNTFNFSTDIIDRWAQNPELKAMIWTKAASPKGSRKDLTFKYFSDRSHRVAKWMSKELGIKKGDRLIIMLPRVPEWWEIVLGVIRIGAVVIPCTTLLTPKDIEYRLRVSHAKVFISDEAGVEKVSQIGNTTNGVSTKVFVCLEGNSQQDNFDGWNDYRDLESKTRDGDRFSADGTNAKDPCIMYFTSGTSGLPKIVVHNNISYPLGHAITGHYWLRLSPGKVYWNNSELGWGKAAWATFSCWSMGATLFIQDDRGAFNSQRYIYNLHEFEITTICAPPTVYRQLVLRKQLDLIRRNKPRALEHCVAGGEALNPDVINTWKRTTGLDIFEGYGQRDGVSMLQFPRFAYQTWGDGKGLSLYPSLCGGRQRERAHPGIEGNIAIRTSPPIPWIFDGYLGEDGSVSRPEVINPETGRRWYLSGDRGTCDKDGYFSFIGRADDVINTAGYRVGPFELESVIKEHRGVVESAVVASPDAERGEIIKAFIVLTDEYRRKREPEQLAKEIQDFVARTTAPYKKPREIEFVDILPKTISGKIQHAVLRAQERHKKSRAFIKGKL